jgi:3-deoxy-manno-octulosonate cytidylyltransferase (CMP-KDO synthetase)
MTQARLSVLGVIPARMGSTRFPNKPLVPIDGHPMIWHTWKRSQLSGAFDTLAIATCDEAIRDVAEGFGAHVVMTSDSHTRSGDRVAEAARHLPGDIILNIQGDEPLVHPELIRAVVAQFDGRPDVQCVNPIAPIVDEEDIDSPNTVKVVADASGRALYFSRYPIPSNWMHARTEPVYRQVPILAFRRQFLFDLAALPEMPLEKQESIDLLRALEHGRPIHVLKTEFQTVGVDVPEDVRRVERILRDDPVYRRCAAEGGTAREPSSPW